MSTLNGRLGDGVVANVLQYLALSRATGCLAIVHAERRQGRIYVEEGSVVHVEARPLYDLPALAALLGWRDGRFAFRPGEAPPRKSMKRNADTLLLEASHLVDTAESAQSVPSAAADTVLRVATRPDQGESVMLSLGALHLWRCVDGLRSLRELAVVTGTPLDQTMAAAQELMDHGLVEFASLAVADPRFVREVGREVVDLLGPFGSIVVEDALIDLGVSAETLPVGMVEEFLGEVARSIQSLDRRAEFTRRAGELRRLFALDARPPGAKGAGGAARASGKKDPDTRGPRR